MISFAEVKKHAAGRWGEILPALTPLPADVLTKRGEDHPCPQCGGKTVIWPAINAEQSGSIACRNCTNNKPQDGIGVVATWTGKKHIEAVKAIADFLGLPVEEQQAKPKSNIAATYDYVNEKGELVFQVVRKQNPKNFIQRRPNGKGGWNWKTSDLPDERKHILFRLPKVLSSSPDDWILIPEGERDVISVEGLNLVATCNAEGAGKWKPGHAKSLVGKKVAILPDNDKTGLDHANDVANSLKGIASQIKIINLPGLPQKGDVTDWIRAGGTREQLLELVEKTEEFLFTNSEESSVEKTEKTSKRPEVVLIHDEAFVANQVVKHLGSLGWSADWIAEELRESVRVFVRGGMLVHAIESEDANTKGMLQIRSLPESLLRERCTQACQLMIERETKDDVEVVPTRPPRWLILAILHRGNYRGLIPPLHGVVQSPTLRADGSILQVPGYDNQSGLIFRANADFPLVPDEPTREDAQRAIESLSHVVVDFPFVDDADRSAWLAMVLSMIGRPAVEGCVPMFTIGANVRGAGKSLLADAASLIAYGRLASRKTFTRDDDEQRKTITAIAIESIPCVLFDNLDVQVGGANIDAALTARTWNDRVLGASKTTGELPMRTVWVATGNNLSYGSDVARRVLPIRLESPLESPEDRSEFVHTNLLEWVLSNRPRLAVDALTILRAYFVAGCPVQSGGVWGSYEDWTRIVRGALVWAGAVDPLPTRKSATDSDETKSLLGMLITALSEADPERNGLTVGEIERIVQSQDLKNPDCPTLLEAVGVVCGDRWNAKKFGRRLLSFKGRTWQDCRIESEPARGGVKKWIVRGGYGGFGGLLYPDPLRAENFSTPVGIGLEACGNLGETNPSNHSNPPPTPPSLNTEGTDDVLFI